MARWFLGFAFVVSLLVLPWWASVAAAILYLAEGGNPFLLVIGGLLFDGIFGAPVASLHGFSYLYTALMIALAVTALYLRETIYE